VGWAKRTRRRRRPSDAGGGGEVEGLAKGAAGEKRGCAAGPKSAAAFLPAWCCCGWDGVCVVL